MLGCVVHGDQNRLGNFFVSVLALVVGRDLSQ